jgi:hypothetical protein
VARNSIGGPRVRREFPPALKSGQPGLSGATRDLFFLNARPFDTAVREPLRRTAPRARLATRTIAA